MLEVLSPNEEIARDRGDQLRRMMEPVLKFMTAEVTELVINEPSKLLIESENGWSLRDVPEIDYNRLMAISAAIATYSRQKIGPTNPLLSAQLPDGERIQVVLPPAVPANTISLTIRRPSTSNRSMDSYQNQGLFEQVIWHEGKDAEIPTDRKLIELLRTKKFGKFFEEAVSNHLNIIIVGDTGSGKTTFMKALCAFIPEHERLITIEDVREIFLKHPNIVHLLYSSTGEGESKITSADLIRSCMRMKPDRVLLAELRGGESYDFLKLLTTGHSGSLTSFHAATCRDAIARFVLMAKEHPEAAAYQDTALKRLLFTAIDVIAHLKAMPIFDNTGHQIGKKRIMTELYFDPAKKQEIAYES